MVRRRARQLGRPSPALVFGDQEQPVRITDQTGSRTEPGGRRMGSYYL